jgi:hypothetical protein
MDALMLSTVCLLCTAQPGVDAAALRPWQPIIAEASARFGIPPRWIERVMLAESGGRTRLNGKPITSVAGAMGLMQIMPDTYAALRRAYGLGADAYAPRDNILAGTAYLRAMYDRYGYPDLFAAYHAGPHRVDAFLLRGRPLPQATLAYVNAIIPNAGRAFAGADSGDWEAASRSENVLFVPLSGDRGPTNDAVHVPRDAASARIAPMPVAADARDVLFVPLTTPPR